MSVYKIINGSAAKGFHDSRVKIRIYAGGFGNGKTTAVVNEALKILREYPGIAVLIARNTFANLEKSVGREFFKWCPESWIKSGTLRSGTVTLINGSTVDFTHLSQTGNTAGDKSSNLLSANYGLIVVDQIEDPEISEKDFDDLLGRLRQQIPQAEGGDPTMPETGPRMMLLTANPSLGWVYRKLVQPFHDYQAGRWNDELLCIRNGETGRPILDADNNVQPLIDLFEATTYDNAQNLPPDFISTLEAKYRGKMRDRYLLGKWVAFDGVVYEEYEPSVHRVPHLSLLEHLSALRAQGEEFRVLEGYDLGITVASCYLHALVDSNGAVYITDGFYEKPFNLDSQVAQMKRIRGDDCEEEINADPAIFRTTSISGRGIGIPPAELFRGHGIAMRRANNNRTSGLLNVMQYLHQQESVVNPFTSSMGAPKLYFSDKLDFLDKEFNTYRWKKDRDDSGVDTTVDKDDHAMDTLRYMLSGTIRPGRRAQRRVYKLSPKVMRWSESEVSSNDSRQHRYS